MLVLCDMLDCRSAQSHSPSSRIRNQDAIVIRKKALQRSLRQPQNAICRGYQVDLRLTALVPVTSNSKIRAKYQMTSGVCSHSAKASLLRPSGRPVAITHVGCRPTVRGLGCKGDPAITGLVRLHAISLLADVKAVLARRYVALIVCSIYQGWIYR